MSTPSPLQPQSQGALEEASSPKSRVRITVLTILALHVVVIGGLLLQGCDKRPPRAATPTNSVSSLPPLTDTSNFTTFPGDTTVGGGAGAAGAGVGAGAASPGGLGGGIAAAPTGGSSTLGGGTAPAPGTTLGGGTLGGGSPIPASPIQPAQPTLGGGSPSSPVATHSGGIGGLPTASSLPPAGAGSTASGNEHVIKPNDRIADLAKKYRVTEAAILEANPSVKPKSLKVGDKLNIPAPAPATAAGSPSTPAAGGAATAAGDAASAPTTTAAGESYVVKQGDTLARIAKKFGISVKQLKSANNLKSDRITPKQKLTIPAKAPAAPAASAAAPARTGGSI